MWKRVPEIGCAVFDIWQHWWNGNQIQKVPPLKFLPIHDMIHLDKLSAGEDEMHGKIGGWHEQWRPARKKLSDLKFLMKYVAYQVQQANVTETVITIAAVDQMFHAVVHFFKVIVMDS